jgi:hypothetical protein
MADAGAVRTIHFIRARLGALARSERGMALPVALFATVSSLALAGAAVMATVDVQRGSKRDNGSKSAIAAADAGANVAMQRLNRYGGSLNSENPCLVLDAGEDLEAAAAPAGEPGWCAPIEGEVGGATYSYRVSALGTSCGPRDVCIVSTGSTDTVDRRIELSLDEGALWKPMTEQEIIQKEIELNEKKGSSQAELEQLEQELEETVENESKGGGIAGLVGREGIVSSGNAQIKVGVATNGDLTTSGNTSVCGSIQIGVGQEWTKSGNAKQCSGYSVTEGTMTLPEVSSFMPSDIATNNSNGRLTKCSGGLPAECQTDTYNGSWTSTSPLNPSKRSISLSGNTILTLGGSDYWLCSLTLSGNSKVIMAQGAHVRVFFDTPENCGTSNQISMSGNNEITATGYQGTPGHFDMPGFYLLGSTTSASQVSLSGNASTTNEMIIYAPNSNIAVSGNAAYKGIIAGRQIAWSGNGSIEQDTGFEIPPELDSASGDGSGAKIIEGKKLSKEEEIKKLEEELDILLKNGGSEDGGRIFNASAYVECSGGAVAAGEAPDAGC